MKGSHREWGTGRDQLDDFFLPFAAHPTEAPLDTVTASGAEALTPASVSDTCYRKPHTSNGAGLLPWNLMEPHIPGVLPVLPQPPDWALLLNATPQRRSLETLVPAPGSSLGTAVRHLTGSGCEPPTA